MDDNLCNWALVEGTRPRVSTPVPVSPASTEPALEEELELRLPSGTSLPTLSGIFNDVSERHSELTQSQDPVLRSSTRSQAVVDAQAPAVRMTRSMARREHQVSSNRPAEAILQVLTTERRPEAQAPAPDLRIITRNHSSIRPGVSTHAGESSIFNSCDDKGKGKRRRGDRSEEAIGPCMQQKQPKSLAATSAPQLSLPTAINPTTSNPIPSGIRPVCPDGNLGGSGSGFGPSQPRKRRRAEDADSDDSTLGEHFQNHAGNYVSSSGFRLDSHSHYNPIPAPIFPAASSGLLELVWPELSAPLPLSNDIVEGHNYGRKGGRSEEADSEDPRAGKRFHADGRNVQADFDPFPGLPHLRGLPPTPVSWNHLINHTSPVVGYPAFDHNPTQGCHEPSSGPNPDRKRRRTQTPDASTGRGGNKRTKMKTKEATPPDFSPPNLALPDMHSERFDLTYQPRSVGELSAGYPNIAHGRSGEFPPWDVDVQFSSADGQTIPNQPSSSRIQVEFQPQSRPNTRNTAASRALTRQTNRLPKKPNASSQGSYDDEAVGTSRVRFTPRSRLCSEVGTSTYTALRRKSPPTETVPQKRTTRRRKSLGPSPSVCNSEPGMSTLVALTQPKGTIPCPHGCSDVMFTRKADLKRHLEGGRHQGKTASCPLCGEEKSRPCAVRRHLKNVHSVKDKTDVDRIMAMGKTNLKADEKKEMQQKRKKKKLAEKEQDLDWDDDDDDNFEQAPEEGNDRDEGEFGTE